MKIENLSLTFGTQLIFDNINIYIPGNEKIGIVGLNGAGKTTFLKIILGKLEPDTGKVVLPNNTRVGWLPQVIDDDGLSLELTVYDFLLSGRPIKNLEKELQKTYTKLSETPDEEKQKPLFKKIDKLQRKLEYWDYYSYENILLKIIDGMNISSDVLNQKVKHLSGGQKSKIAFAKLLYSKPEIILLDEPTNHLDKETKDFVVNYLKKYKGSVFVISHDISFLNDVTNKTLYLEKATKRMQLYDGNYDRFIKVHSQREEALLKQAKIEEKQINKLQETVDKYSNVSGKRKKMAQDREKKLEKLKENRIQIAPTQKSAKINMTMNRESGNIPLKVENISFKYNKDSNKYIINNLSFEINKGEKFLIVGENGVGKSTLLKLIVGQLKVDSGNIILGNKTDIGYYAQEHELLDNNKTILDNFSDINISQRQLRNVLGRFLFFNDDVFKKVSVLSPGEKSRVALAKLSLKGANLLILDEPTNHLDPQTQEIIAKTFSTFSGTMLIVSHNPQFVDNLGIERTLVLPEGKISYYDKQIVEHFHETNIKKMVYKKKQL